MAPCIYAVLILTCFWQKVNKKSQKITSNLHFILEKCKKELYNEIEKAIRLQKEAES